VGSESSLVVAEEFSRGQASGCHNPWWKERESIEERLDEEMNLYHQCIWEESREVTAGHVRWM
jgi:hypothetical protein